MLAEDVMAQEPIPSVPTSIMDGYAVVAQDGAGEFDIVGGVVLPSIVSLLVHKPCLHVTYWVRV